MTLSFPVLTRPFFLAAVAAARAGKDVYGEKPFSHDLKEGRAMVNAARAAGRVVQVGTHRRVSPHNVSGREFIRSGKLGKIGMVRAFVLYGGGPEKPQKVTDPPKELDWNLWCGPAPVRPPARRRPTAGKRRRRKPGSWRSGRLPACCVFPRSSHLSGQINFMRPRVNSGIW